MNDHEKLDRIEKLCNSLAANTERDEVKELINQLRRTVNQAADWRKNKDAVFVARKMLDAARPLVHSLLNTEAACKAYNEGDKR